MRRPQAGARRGSGVTIGLTMLVVAVAHTTGAPPVSAAPVDVIGGHIEWGVKVDFRGYVSGGPAQGMITPSGGATQAAGNGVFTFPNLSGTYDTAGSKSVDSDGTVRFVGHHGALDIQVSDVRVQVTGAIGNVVADVVSLPLSGPPANTYDDITLVTFDAGTVVPNVVGNTITYTTGTTSLTAAGVPAFANFYPAGEPFDPITFVADLEPPPVYVGDLSWKVSTTVQTSGSLNQAQTVGAPATKDGSGNFHFPATTASYNPTTGETDVQFDGSVTLGNTSFGNFRIAVEDPRLTVGTAGAGRLTATISYCLAPCSGPMTTSPQPLTMVRFPVNPAAVDDSGESVTATYTPDPWPFTAPFPGVNAFDTEFANFLPASVRPFFQASNATGSNLNKPPLPINVQFDHDHTGIDAISAMPDFKVTGNKDHTRFKVNVTNTEAKKFTVSPNDIDVTVEVNGTTVPDPVAPTTSPTRTVNPGKATSFNYQWDHGASLQAGDVVTVTSCVHGTGDEFPANDCSTTTSPNGPVDIGTATALSSVTSKSTSITISSTSTNAGGAPVLLRPDNVTSSIFVNEVQISPTVTSKTELGKRALVQPTKTKKYQFVWTVAPLLSVGDTVKVITCVNVPGDVAAANNCSEAVTTLVK